MGAGAHSTQPRLVWRRTVTMVEPLSSSVTFVCGLASIAQWQASAERAAGCPPEAALS